jgi:Replication-relaxation
MGQTAKRHKFRKTKAFVVGQADYKILWEVNRFHYLTAYQLTRLIYPKFLRYQHPKDRDRESQRRLRDLEKAGFVLRLRDLPTGRYGSFPHVFTLAAKGRQYLAAAGVSVPSYFRPSEERDKAWNNLFMPHNLAVIDVLIAGAKLAQELEQVQLARLRTQQALKRQALSVSIPGPAGQQQQAKLIPDSWFQLQVGGDEVYSIALELDRDTEEQKSWRRKVAAYCALIEKPYTGHRGATQLSLYEQAFAAEELTIAVVTPNPKRRDELRGWTAQELERIGIQTDAFLFTAEDPVTTTPHELFFGKCWYLPTDGRPVSLLEPLRLLPDSTHGVSLSQRAEP